MRVKKSRKKIWIFLVIVVVIFLFGLTISYRGVKKQSNAMTDAEKEAYLFSQKANRLKEDIGTMLFLDGVDNEKSIQIFKLNNTNFGECMGDSQMIVAILIDMTSETSGTIDRLVGDDFTWGMDSARRTFTQLYKDHTSAYGDDYSKDVGLTFLTFIKTPKPTIDKYGNEIQQEEQVVGQMGLCKSEAVKINWKNMDNIKLRDLVIIDWEGSRGTNVLERISNILD